MESINTNYATFSPFFIPNTKRDIMFSYSRRNSYNGDRTVSRGAKYWVMEVGLPFNGVSCFGKLTGDPLRPLIQTILPIALEGTQVKDSKKVNMFCLS